MNNYGNVKLNLSLYIERRGKREPESTPLTIRESGYVIPGYEEGKSEIEGTLDDNSGNLEIKVGDKLIINRRVGEKRTSVNHITIKINGKMIHLLKDDRGFKIK